MRVAFLLIDGNVTGGQVVAHELMRGVRDRGGTPLAFLPTGGPMAARLEADGIAVARLPLARSYRIDQARGFARTLKGARCNLVNTHSLYVGNQLARLAASFARIPLVQHSHIVEHYSGRPSVARLQHLIERGTIKIPAAFVAVSEPVRDQLIASGAPAERVSVVRNGVALGPDTDPPQNPGLTLVCAARLAAVKGQDVLLAALALAPADIRVRFVGDDLEGGSFRSDLERQVSDLGLGERVEFLGHRNDLDELLDASDGLVLPSRDEGLPLVALEAMARSRPVIATAVGGLPSLVHDGESGLLVAAEAPAELAAALVRLRDDPQLRRSLAHAGRARVAREFSADRMREQTLAIFDQVAR